MIYAAEERHVLLGDRENPARLSITRGRKDCIIDAEAMKKDGGMADRFLREVERMHQLRRDINEMTPEEADELIRGLAHVYLSPV